MYGSLDRSVLASDRHINDYFFLLLFQFLFASIYLNSNHLISATYESVAGSIGPIEVEVVNSCPFLCLSLLFFCLQFYKTISSRIKIANADNKR